MLKLLPFFRKANPLSEIMQSVDLKFAFCTVENEQVTRCHDFVKCRDFLGDVLDYTNNKKPVDIYHFEYNETYPPIDKSKLSLLLKFPNEKIKDIWFNNQSLLALYSKFNIEETDDPLIWVLTAKSFWQKTFVMLSLYTFVLKCMCYSYEPITNWMEQLVQTKTIEGDYINKVGIKELDYLLNNCYNIFVNTTETTGWETYNLTDYAYKYKIHDDSGFVYMLTKPNSTNTLHQRYYNYVNKHTAKATKRVTNKSKKVVQTFDTAAMVAS